jgi:hypothetical protein
MAIILIKAIKKIEKTTKIRAKNEHKKKEQKKGRLPKGAPHKITN